MKKILLEIKMIIDESNTDNYDSNFINGEKIMFILLTKTNFENLKNSIKCLRKIVAKLSQKKNLDQVYKYCKLVGLEQNENTFKNQVINYDEFDNFFEPDEETKEAYKNRDIFKTYEYKG
jgi:uncharacterized protein YjgD (DUF1641 family)